MQPELISWSTTQTDRHVDITVQRICSSSHPRPCSSYRITRPTAMPSTCGLRDVRARKRSRQFITVQMSRNSTSQMSSRHILQQKKVQVIRMHRLLNKYLFLFDVGGLLYILIELAWRGWSHWTMFILGGICFIYLGLINEALPWSMPLWQQILIGAVGITILELLTGCIVNLWLGWDVWDYSGMPSNILGQICPQYMLLWLPVALAGIVLDDWIRYWKFGEERPHYRLI